MAKKLYLIDGYSYFFRAYHAIQHLTNAQGLPTNAIFGFTNMLLKILEQEKPDYLVLALDSKTPSFRKEIDTQYKANRDAMPEDLAAQIPYIKSMAKAFRVCAIEVPRYEADDILATLVRRFASADIDITIVSGDKDLLQMVTPKITMLDTMRDLRYTPEEVERKYGVPPAKLLDLFSLSGDSSDNIPGVPGIGLKTAAQLIQAHHSLDQLLAHPEAVKGESKAEKLRVFADQARLSRRLLRLCDDVPLDIDLESLRVQPPNREEMLRMFQELDFRKLLGKFADAGETSHKANGAGQKSARKYRALTSLADLEDFIGGIRENRLPLSVDLESTSVDPMRAEIVGISLCARKGEGVYVPIAHEGVKSQPPLAAVLSVLKTVLEDPRIGKYGQNIKYDDVILRRHGIVLTPVAFDPMLASYLLQADQRGSHNLDRLCEKYLYHHTITYEEVTEGIPDRSFAKVPLERAVAYACEDSDMVLYLEEAMRPILRDEKLEDLLCEVELPLSSILARMEVHGIKVDGTKLRDLSREFEHEIGTLTQSIYETVGKEFLITSPKQLQEILFDQLGFPHGKRTKTGFSTDNEVLSSLVDHPDVKKMDPRYRELPDLLLRFRKVTKLKSTYVDSLPELMDPDSNRVHTRYNQAVTATGRLSSSDPNLQNIPIRDPEGELIRSAFVAEEGCLLLGADYSQIELRVFAHFAQDPTLLEAFQRGVDIHLATATAIFHCSPKEVSAEQRRRAKMINFGILYGMSEFRLARELGISLQEATDFMRQYFATYPEVARFIETVHAEAHRTGFVRTYLGRKRALPDMNSKNQNLRKAAEREAVSTVIQGSAADLIKVAMIRLDQRLRRERLQSEMILQVHDELVLEVPACEKEKVSVLVKEEMEGVFSLRVPLVVDLHLGKTWLDVH